MKFILFAFLSIISINTCAQKIDKVKLDTYINYIENNNAGIRVAMAYSLLKNQVFGISKCSPEE